MTVETTTTIAGPYPTNGTATAFPFNFKALSAEEVEVLLVSGSAESVVSSSLYRVTLADQSGTVVFTTAPDAGASLYVRANPDFTQSVKFSNQSAFLPDSHNEANDRGALRSQVLAADLARAPKTPLDPTAAAGMYPKVQADGSWGYDVAGPGAPGPAGNVAGTLDDLKAAPTTNRTMIAAYDGSGSTMTWTLGDYRTLNASRPQDYVQANGVSLQNGAWVRQNVRALVAQLNAPGAAIMSQEDVNAERVSVLRFGADWTGQTDTTDQIQACVDWLSSVGGGEVELTRGNYKTTRPISLPSNVGWVGQGPCSVLRPQSCNGINIQKSDGIGPRRVDDFWIYGNGGDAYCGIEANIAFPDRVTGLTFSNVYVSFMGTAIKGRGFWHTTFRDITINQVYNGVVLYDRNVHVYLSAIRATKGGLVTGSGPSIGIQLGDSVSALRPEDVHIAHSITVGFDDGLYWRNVLAGSVIATTFDFCKRNGIHLVTADGNSSFRDIYIQADATDGILRAVYCEPLGTLPGAGTIVFDTVSTRASSTPSVPGELRSFGFDIANNQANITVKDCSSEGFQVDVRADGAQRSIVQNHRGSAQAIMFNSKYGALKNSFFPGGITLSGNLAIDFSENNGLHATSINVLIDVPAGATTVTTTFLSLNKPDLPLGGYTIIPSVDDYGTVNHGGMSIVPTRTAVTVNLDKALAVSSTLSVTLRII